MIGKPPYRTSLVDAAGLFKWAWMKWFDSVQDTANAPANNPAPTADTAGTMGQMAVDDTYLYVYTPSGIWKKVALTAL